MRLRSKCVNHIQASSSGRALCQVKREAVPTRALFPAAGRRPSVPACLNMPDPAWDSVLGKTRGVERRAMKNTCVRTGHLYLGGIQ